MNITNVEKLTNEKWANLFAAHYQHNGYTGRWVFVSRKEKPYTGITNDAVLIVPILRNPGEPPRLVMIREFRVPIGSHVYGLPAGLLEHGENIEDTIRREVREETGFAVKEIKRITQPLLSTAGLTDEAVALAFVDVEGAPESIQYLEGGEDIKVLLVDLQEVNRLCDDETILIDAKTWTVLYLYRQLGKLE